MLTSVSLIFLVGLAFASICNKIKLPRIIGMLFTGILLGPYVLDFLDPAILGISAELRKMALVIILIKAGLSLNIHDLKKVGRPAILLSFVPALFEISACILFAPLFLKLSVSEAAVMGAVLAAVSPAVVVPRMVNLIEQQRGTDKHIPQMILAGSSLDDVFVIVMFTSFIGMAQGSSFPLSALIGIPVSMVSGLLLGTLVGFLITMFFESKFRTQQYIRNSTKVIIILGVSFLLLSCEEWLKNIVPVSGLLSVMSMSIVLAYRSIPQVTLRLQQKFSKLWIAAEVLLFVLVGAAVDIRATFHAGLVSFAIIGIGLLFRSAGVLLSLIGTDLNQKERLFCVIAYMPKATVQAAIGSVPLSLGMPCGQIVLSIAVLSILITAPLGALAMDFLNKRLLTCDVHK